MLTYQIMCMCMYTLGLLCFVMNGVHVHTGIALLCLFLALDTLAHNLSISLMEIIKVDLGIISSTLLLRVVQTANCQENNV